MSIRIIGEINAGILPRCDIHLKSLTREEVREIAQDPELMGWSTATLYLKEIIQRELGGQVRTVIGSTQPLVLKPGTSWLLARVHPLRDAIDWWLITVADDAGSES